MIKDSNDKGFGSIDNAKSTLGKRLYRKIKIQKLTDFFYFTLAYYIRTLDEIKGETSRKDQLKIRFQLPVLRFYLASIDKLNLDSVGTSKSVKFTRQILTEKYPHLVHKKLYGRLYPKFFRKSIKNLARAVFKGSVDRTKGMYHETWSRLNKLKSSPNKQEHLEVDAAVEGLTDAEEFDLT